MRIAASSYTVPNLLEEEAFTVKTRTCNFHLNENDLPLQEAPDERRRNDKFCDVSSSFAWVSSCLQCTPSGLEHEIKAQTHGAKVLCSSIGTQAVLFVLAPSKVIWYIQAGADIL